MGHAAAGLSDPYVRVTVGLHSRKTAVVHKSLFPIWNETLRLYVWRSALALACGAAPHSPWRASVAPWAPAAAVLVR